MTLRIRLLIIGAYTALDVALVALTHSWPWLYLLTLLRLSCVASLLGIANSALAQPRHPFVSDGWYRRGISALVPVTLSALASWRLPMQFGLSLAVAVVGGTLYFTLIKRLERTAQLTK